MKNSEYILNHLVCGYRQYNLTSAPALCFVSENLLNLTGYHRDELENLNTDKYINIVHPSDRETYESLLKKAKMKPQTLTEEYRLIKKDGSVIFVRDTLISEYDGEKIFASSTLSDITALKTENSNLSFLNDTIPCGFIKYTCEKQPRITYINEKMMNFFGFGNDRSSREQFSLCKENIFLMIPMEERRRFSLFLRKVKSQNAPMAGELTVLKADGNKAYLFGWVTKAVNEDGTEEFQSVCIDVTESHLVRKARESGRYLRALTDVYDLIFEFDFSRSTVKCLHAQNSDTFRNFQNIPMQMEEATEKWIDTAVADDDKSDVRSFFRGYYQRRNPASSGSKPTQIKYRARSFDGSLHFYSGIFLKTDPGTSLFCCRKTPENAPELHNMQEIMSHFTDGIAAFEVRNDTVTPLYASRNVYEFFGLTKEEWLPLMKKSTLIKEFVAKSNTKYEEFLALLKNGEAEFTYTDSASGKERRIKAICSEKSPTGTSPRYVMLYNIDENEQEAASEKGNERVYIRTFGYFDVFVDGKPIAFRNKKSEELYALLADRRGGFVTSEEAISYLWEDEPVSSVTLARYRKVALRLKNILEEYGIADTVEAIDGKRRIVTDKVRCDLYDYLSGKDEYRGLFKGSYLTDYSWGETTLGELENYK